MNTFFICCDVASYPLSYAAIALSPMTLMKIPPDPDKEKLLQNHQQQQEQQQQSPAPSGPSAAPTPELPEQKPFIHPHPNLVGLGQGAMLGQEHKPPVPVPRMFYPDAHTP